MVGVYRGRQMIVEVVSASEGGEGKETWIKSFATVVKCYSMVVKILKTLHILGEEDGGQYNKASKVWVRWGYDVDAKQQQSPFACDKQFTKGEANFSS